MGKSTDLKLLVRRALREGLAPRSICYLSLDVLQDVALAGVVDAFLSLTRLSGGSGRRLALLDEVIAVRRWQFAVKHAWDTGVCEPAARQAETWALPDRLHVWQTAGGGEVDFVCGLRPELAAVEVRYQARPDLRKAGGMKRGFPGRPVIVVTRDRLEWRSGYALIPASPLLWALG